MKLALAIPSGPPGVTPMACGGKATLSQQAYWRSDRPGYVTAEARLPLETLRLRVASLGDAKRLYDWSLALDAETVTPWGQPVWEDHLTWLKQTLGPADQLILIGEAIRTDQAIGAIRLDALGPGLWSIEIILDPQYRGRGWSRKLLLAGISHFPEASFLARVPRGEGAVQALFRGAGFQTVRTTDGVDLLQLNTADR